MKLNIEDHIQASASAITSLLAQTSKVVAIAGALVSIIQKGGRIYSCGNGGSSCDAMHLTEELVARYKRERPGIAAHHLCDAGTITCWANDYEFEGVFSRQVETLVTANDALVCFSTSGNSANILSALETARAKGAVSVAFLGKGGGKALSLATHSVVVSSDVTAHIQEAHITLVHILCELLETALFPTAKT